MRNSIKEHAHRSYVTVVGNTETQSVKDSHPKKGGIYLPANRRVKMKTSLYNAQTQISTNNLDNADQLDCRPPPKAGEIARVTKQRLQ